MIEKTITVTEAARTFADCVNRAHYQNTTFVLLKNGVRFARLVPDGEKRCTGRDLAATLSTSKLSDDDARRWNDDLKSARKTLKPPVDKWQ